MIEEATLEASAALATYRNYIAALWDLLETRHRGPGGRYRRLADEHSRLSGVGRTRPVRGYDQEAIRGALFNAWHTEAVLTLPGDLPDGGLIRFTNQWAPVQAYYSVYSLMRAWFLAERRETRSHRGALRSMSSLLDRDTLPPPWSWGCQGGHLLQDVSMTGFPPGLRIRNLNALTTPPGDYLHEEWVAKILRTTRRFFLAELEYKWKTKNRTKAGWPYKRIPSIERQRIRRNLHRTTLFDFFYRLRVRSNYRDIDDFVSGQLSDDDAQTYFRSLLYFTRATMLVLEALIRVRMQAGEFDRMAGRFLGSERRAAHSFLGHRLEALRAAFG